MPRIELMDWQSARRHAAPIRFEVFVSEQGVPADIELDDMDARSIHGVAFEGDKAIGTARLLPDGHIGRMAVLKACRGRGVGGFLLKKLIDKAKEQGNLEVVLSAQVHAVPFYLRHGFRCEGPVYEEAGIAHQAMRRGL